MTLFRLFVVLVTFIHLSVGQEDGRQLFIKPKGERHVKSLGETIVLTCEISKLSTGDNQDEEEEEEGGDNVVLDWLDTSGNTITETEGRRSVEGVERKKLFIRHIQESDAGQYICRATLSLPPSGGRNNIQKTVNLYIFEDVTFVNVSLTSHPVIHTNALIECTVRGSPIPVVSWKYNGQTISTSRSGSRYRKVPNGLTIENITETDNGRYTCRAEQEDQGRYDERKIDVIVYVPPTMIGVKLDHQGIEGQRINISCSANGIPTPTYQFFKDGVLITSSESVDVDVNGGVLRLSPVSKSDEGDYFCRAVNTAGHAEQRHTMRVLVKASIYSFSSVTQPEGKRAILSCQSHGDPAPSMSITRVDTSLTSNQQQTEVGPGHVDLVLDDLQITDTGRYECTTDNGLGEVGEGDVSTVSRQTATITVQYKPRFVTTVDRVVYTWPSSEHNLTCQSYGLPPPTVEWYRFDTVIAVSNETYRIYQQTDHVNVTTNLQISVGEEEVSWMFSESMFVCKSTNEIGSESVTFEIRQAVSSQPSVLPGEPQGINVETYADSVDINVIEPLNDGGVPIIGYSYRIYKQQLQPVPAAAAELNVQSSIDSDDDEIDEDNNDNDIRPSTDPPHFELMTTATDYGSDDNGNVDDEDDDDDNRALTNFDGELLSDNFEGNHTKISGLQPETRYVIKVRARNAVGGGLELDSSFTTEKKSVPGLLTIKSDPIASSSSSSYHVQWELKDNGGSAVLEYQLNYTDTDSVETYSIISPVSAASTTGEYRLTELRAGSTYTLTMRAKNEYGWSLPTALFTFRTNNDKTHPEPSPRAADGTGPIKLSASLGLGPVVGLIVAVFILILVAVDVSCYFVNHCGLTAHFCAARRQADKSNIGSGTDKDTERGRDEENVPLTNVNDKEEIETKQTEPIVGKSSEVTVIKAETPTKPTAV